MHNKLSHLRALAPLQAAPCLLVLDASGNPVAQNPDYAQYVIWRMRALRVHDGTAVTAAAVAAARAQYSGRLTLEFLEDQAGPTDWARCGAGATLLAVLRPGIETCRIAVCSWHGPCCATAAHESNYRCAARGPALHPSPTQLAHLPRTHPHAGTIAVICSKPTQG